MLQHEKKINDKEKLIESNGNPISSDFVLANISDFFSSRSLINRRFVNPLQFWSACEQVTLDLHFDSMDWEKN